MSMKKEPVKTVSAPYDSILREKWISNPRLPFHTKVHSHEIVIVAYGVLTRDANKIIQIYTISPLKPFCIFI